MKDIIKYALTAIALHNTDVLLTNATSIEPYEVDYDDPRRRVIRNFIHICTHKSGGLSDLLLKSTAHIAAIQELNPK
jgi:hypothetical protein